MTRWPTMAKGLAAPMIRFWALRSRREQALILGAGLMLLIWGGYALIWHPMRMQAMALEARIARLDRLTAELNGLPAQMPAVGSDAAAMDDRPLAIIATTTAEEAALVLGRLQPEGTALRIESPAADFASLLLWLESLQRDHGLQITALSLERLVAPGQVSAGLTVERLP